MAYDEELAARYRSSLNGKQGISEKRMMGGVCFFHHGNMIGGADRTKKNIRRFMFRVGKENEVEALARQGATIVELGPRRMGGLIFVDEKYCTGDQLGNWIELALGFVSTLPPKK